MSPRLPRVTAADVVRALHRDKWYDVRQRGSHLALCHATKVGKVTVPMHSGQDLTDATLHAILKQAQLSEEEFRRLL